MSDHEKDVDAATGVETTGHEWDGIKELNNPLPRWWLWIFYATIVWAVVYWVFMPAWPGLPGMGHTRGLRDHSDRALVAEAVAKLEADRKQDEEAIMNASVDEILGDQQMRNFAFASGEAIFKDRCVTCHGPGGQGAPGYPTLIDDAWIWGGELEEIEHTIRYGIRQDGIDETRFGNMTPFGGEFGTLSPDEIDNVAHYVRVIADLEEPSEASKAGEDIFYNVAFCQTCHGEDAKGMPMMGAPNLTDGAWIYGSDFATVRSSIANPKNSQMPAWGKEYSDAQIKALAVYVYSLSQS